MCWPTVYFNGTAASVISHSFAWFLETESWCVAIGEPVLCISSCPQDSTALPVPQAPSGWDDRHCNTSILLFAGYIRPLTHLHAFFLCPPSQCHPQSNHSDYPLLTYLYLDLALSGPPQGRETCTSYEISKSGSLALTTVLAGRAQNCDK